MPDNNEQPTPKLRDFRQEVTDNIVALLEKGVAPWQKPWDAQSQTKMPVNPTTDRGYRGGNAIHLLAVGLQRNYDDPRWMTYKQASEQGWQVRKGERGTQIEFWDVKPQQEGPKDTTRSPIPSKDGDKGKGDEPSSKLIHRVYTVFNARQIDGIPAPTPIGRKPFEVVEAGERILNGSGAKIAHDQANHAFYDRRKDEIHLPAQQSFKDSAGYYGTALHELAHWSGHPTRLNRYTLAENYKFGDTNYAKEELRAELASVFLAAEKGIPHNPENHAAYVGSWIQSLKQDKNEIFRAAHDASKATDFLLSLDRDISIANQSLDTQALQTETTIAETSQLERDREAIQERPAENYSVESRNVKTAPTSPFNPGDKVMAYEPYFYGGKPKPNPWTPGIVASLYADDQYISYVRPQNENGNKAVEYASKGDMHHASPEELKQHETEFAILEQKLPHSLREQMEAERKPEVTTQESTQVAARSEPENGAVSVSDKQTGTERRIQLEKSSIGNGTHATLQSQTTPAADHLQEAASLTAQLLGQHAKTKPATLTAGSYRGQIIAETSETVLQRLSPKSSVVHEKDLFSEVPKVGANVAINYIEGNPSVRPIKERGRALEMSR